MEYANEELFIIKLKYNIIMKDYKNVQLMIGFLLRLHLTYIVSSLLFL